MHREEIAKNVWVGEEYALEEKQRGGVISRFEYNRGEIHAEIVRGKLEGSSVQ